MSNSALSAGAEPAGSILLYAGSSAPSGWLLCDGSAVSRTTYAGLFAVCGTTYGAGDGSTTFNLPDLRGRVAVGPDTGGVHLAVNKPALGGTGGEEQHTLTTGELPAHTHSIPHPVIVDGQAGGSYGTGAFSFGDSTATTTGSVGSGVAHNIVQPYLSLNFLIKT